MIQITTMIRGYKRPGYRRIALAQLRRRGYNYFVFFRDVQSEYALQYGKAAWVKPGDYHLDP